MGGFPLSLLVVLDLGIGHRLQLFDDGTQLLLLHSPFVRVHAVADPGRDTMHPRALWPAYGISRSTSSYGDPAAF